MRMPTRQELGLELTNEQYGMLERIAQGYRQPDKTGPIAGAYCTSIEQYLLDISYGKWGLVSCKTIFFANDTYIEIFRLRKIPLNDENMSVHFSRKTI
jgi:hypothetical protein